MGKGRSKDFFFKSLSFFSAVAIKITVVWDVTPYGMSPDYTVSHPIPQLSSVQCAGRKATGH